MNDTLMRWVFENVFISLPEYEIIASGTWDSVLLWIDFLS